MKTSAHGIKLIEQREGVVLHGYNDSRGFLTIGCGHLVKKGESYKLGQTIPQSECDRLLAADLAEVENTINKFVTAKLNQNQFDALVSLGFNIGVHALGSSTVVRKLNKGDYPGAAEAILLWNRPPEIRKRRHGEYEQFKLISATAQPAVSIPSVPDPADANIVENSNDSASIEQLPSNGDI